MDGDNGFTALTKALSQQNTNVEALLAAGTKQADAIAELKARTLDLEQKLAKRPGGGGGVNDDRSALGELVSKSDQLAAFRKGASTSVTIEIPAELMKTLIVNTPGIGQ